MAYKSLLNITPRFLVGIKVSVPSTMPHFGLKVVPYWMNGQSAWKASASTHLDRFFFESLYARVEPGILFEFATDGPGFMGDEPYETPGKKLSLPPFLKAKRGKVEKLVRPIDTVRSTKEFVKE